MINEATSEANHTGTVRLGSWLSPEGNHTSWSSSSGHFAFGFYPQGEGYAIGVWLVTQPNNTIVWTANRDNPPLPSNSTLTLTKNGGLLLHEGGKDPENVTHVSGEPVASAAMLDSGNFVLYGKNYEVVWSSFTDPTDTMLGGQNLTDNLFSSMSVSDHSTGHFYLTTQYDGMLAAFPVNSSDEWDDSYWLTKCYGSNSVLSLSIEGFLCINLEDNNTSCFNSTFNLRKKLQNTTTSIYRATLGEDGNFRLYAHQFEGNTTNSSVQLLWEAMNDTCQVKGLCGLNSYCSNMTGKAVCHCYPGFVPYKSRSNDTMFLECKQNNSRYNCEGSTDEDSTVVYNMTYLQDIQLRDSPYLVVPMKIEACEKSCLEDYDCGAVLYLYTSGVCNKYRLPLMHGRRLQDASMVALIKMPSGNVSSRTPNQTVPSPMERKALADDKKSLLMILYLTLGCISFFGLVLVVYIFLTYKRQVYKYAMLSRSENLGFTEDYSLRSFSFDELVKSTGGFTEEVGRGSFGAVYRGTMIGSNRRIAVKRLEKTVDEGEREFQAEITAIAQTHHRNLVKLIGFCIDGSRKLLVYEYVSNGSLANLLFKSHLHLPWNERVKIALDVAKGVLYLHEECEVRIIHCNIKPQNILLDEARTAKISDFGFARLLKTEYSRVNIMDDQRSRYLAPEWQKDESMSVKVDVYSFGIVLLEIACRRSNIDINVSSPEEILLSSWVYQCFAAGELNKLVADGVGEDVDWKILERMVKVGLWCVQDKPSLRPSMKNVILMLEGFKDIPVPPSPTILVK